MRKIILSLTALFLALGINGCEEKIITRAKVVDSTVEGIEYQCAGMVNYTPKSGELACYHMPLGFKVGEIKIGILYEVPSDGIIFPQDMLGVARENIRNEDVKKLTVLLQSVDSDSNPKNGITITKETREKLNDFIDLKKISFSELKDYLEAKLNKELVPQEKAIEHLYHSMRQYKAIGEDFKLSY